MLVKVKGKFEKTWLGKNNDESRNVFYEEKEMQGITMEFYLNQKNV